MNNVTSNWKEDYLNFMKQYKIPENEELTLRQANSEGEILYFVTYNKRVNEYYLYKIKDGKSKKSKTNDNPNFKELERL